jgi:DNA-directed RNA polymerase specialized sigma24 family protein
MIMEADDYYFLTATAQEIWLRGVKEEEDKLLEALYRIRKEKYFPRVIYLNGRVATERMMELAEAAFLRAWEDFSRDGRARKNKTKERSYVWYFFGIFRYKFLDLLGEEQVRLQAEAEFGSRYSVESVAEFEIGRPALFSAAIEAVLRETGENCRELLIWRFAERLSHDEIARRRAMTRDSSIKMVARCKKRFLERRINDRYKRLRG